MPEHELGPVRALGWLREDRKPLLNAKLLVLGHLALNVYDPDNGYGEEVLDFEPRTVCGDRPIGPCGPGHTWKLALHATTQPSSKKLQRLSLT